MSVGARIGDDDETRLFEGACDVVCEVSWGKSACDGSGAGVGGELEDGALTVGTCGYDGDVGGIVDCSDDAGGENDFLPAAS